MFTECSAWPANFAITNCVYLEPHGVSHVDEQFRIGLRYTCQRFKHGPRGTLLRMCEPFSCEALHVGQLWTLRRTHRATSTQTESRRKREETTKSVREIPTRRDQVVHDFIPRATKHAPLPVMSFRHSTSEVPHCSNSDGLSKTSLQHQFYGQANTRPGSRNHSS